MNFRIFLPREKINLFNFRVSSFHFFGVLGFSAGTGLGITLAVYLQLPLWVLCFMSVLGAVELLFHTWVQKLVTGEENLVYYRHEIGILALCALTLWVIGQPVVSFLEISLLGVGVFLGFGRWGCYHVGCCHGRPCLVGVRYSEEHARDGFPFYYVGVRIFPIQLIESFFVFMTVIVGTLIILRGFAAGTALVWYTVFYGSVRFMLEFFRGDAERRYWRGFSEAQWTTLLLLLVTAALSAVGVLPFYIWHHVAAAVLIMGMAGVAIYRRWRADHLDRLLSPQHIRELAYGLWGIDRVKDIKNDAQKQLIPLSRTSQGLRVSCGEIHQGDRRTLHFTFSGSQAQGDKKGIILDRPTMAVLGRLLQMMRYEGKAFEVVEGRAGIFHILFEDVRESYPPHENASTR